MTQKVFSGPRNIAIVGPYSSGKTTLLESLLYISQAIPAKAKLKRATLWGMLLQKPAIAP